MNKRELIQAVTNGSGLTKTGAEKAITAVIEAIESGLKQDGTVNLVGFGCFTVKERKARVGRNPKTGETINIGPKKTVGFKPGKNLKATIANG